MIIISGLKHQDQSRYLSRYNPNINPAHVNQVRHVLIDYPFHVWGNIVINSGNRNTMDLVSKNIPYNYIKRLHQLSRHEGQALRFMDNAIHETLTNGIYNTMNITKDM